MTNDDGSCDGARSCLRLRVVGNEGTAVVLFFCFFCFFGRGFDLMGMAVGVWKSYSKSGS